MDAIPSLKPVDIEPYLHILEIVRDSKLLERFDVDISARMADVQEQIRSVSGRWYEDRSRDIHSGAGAGVNLALPLLLMTDEIEKSAKLLDKRFPEPILRWVLTSGVVAQLLTGCACSQIDVVSLFVEISIPLFLQDLDASSKRLFENSRNGPTPDVPIQDIFALYRRSKSLMGMYKAFCPQCVFSSRFIIMPYVLSEAMPSLTWAASSSRMCCSG